MGTYIFVNFFRSKLLQKWFFISKFSEKILKTSYLDNYRDLRSHFQGQNSQPLEVPSHFPKTRLRLSQKFGTFQNLSFFKNFWTNKKNVISRKLQGFEKRHSEERFATPESILAAPKYRVTTSKIENFF